MALPGPLPAFHFFIALVDDSHPRREDGAATPAFVLGGFTECSGLESEIKVEEVLAGGHNDRVYRFPGRAAYPNITLSRGVGFSDDLYLWHQSFLKGQGKRRNGLIFLAGETRTPIKCWTFERGIPVKWSGPALNATNAAVAIERLEIAHEKLSLAPPLSDRPGDAAGAVRAEAGL